MSLIKSTNLHPSCCVLKVTCTFADGCQTGHTLVRPRSRVHYEKQEELGASAMTHRSGLEEGPFVKKLERSEQTLYSEELVVWVSTPICTCAPFDHLPAAQQAQSHRRCLSVCISVIPR